MIVSLSLVPVHTGQVLDSLTEVGSTLSDSLIEVGSTDGVSTNVVQTVLVIKSEPRVVVNAEVDVVDPDVEVLDVVDPEVEVVPVGGTEVELVETVVGSTISSSSVHSVEVVSGIEVEEKLVGATVSLPGVVVVDPDVEVVVGATIVELEVDPVDVVLVDVLEVIEHFSVIVVVNIGKLIFFQSSV